MSILDRAPLSEGWLAPFRASKFSLRFELGGEQFGTNAPVPRFIQAFDRARSVTDAVLSTTSELIGVVATAKPAGRQFAKLDAMGFACDCIQEWSAPLWPDEPDEEDRVASLWRAYDLRSDQLSRDILLWAAVAIEMPITPRAEVMPYLIDVERNLLVHVYDDRGMDVIALAREPLLPLYRSHREWLLDYDRPRMEAAFGTL